MLWVRIRLSTPEIFIISKATAVDALPEIGLINIKGRSFDGICIKLRIGDRIFSNRSNIPEVLRAEIAKNKPTRVGNIWITVFIPIFCAEPKNYQKPLPFLQARK